MGINEDYAFNYISDSVGNSVVYGSISEKILNTRRAPRHCKSSNLCMKNVSSDYESRNGKKKV